MFDASTDPGGISLMNRARQNRLEYEQQNRGRNFGPLSDPRWDGFFQAMNEAGVSRIADNSVGEARGMFPGKEPLPSTYDPTYQQSAVDTMPSNQIGVAGPDAPLGVRGGSIPSMDALTRATGGFTVSPSKGRMRVQTQRGTNGLNHSERA